MTTTTIDNAKILLLTETDVVFRQIETSFDNVQKMSLPLTNDDFLVDKNPGGVLRQLTSGPLPDEQIVHIVDKLRRWYDANESVLSSYDRIILFTNGTKNGRTVMTTFALWLTKQGYAVNIFAFKYRGKLHVDRKIRQAFQFGPLPVNGVGDGITVIPSSFPNLAVQKSVRRLSVSHAEDVLKNVILSGRSPSNEVQNHQRGEKLVIAVDPGAGKTTTLAKNYASLGPLLFVSPTIKLAEDFCATVEKEHGSGIAAVFRGRTADLCHKKTDVDLLGQFRRSIAANLCQNCEHGIKTQIDLGSEKAATKKIELELLGVNFSNAKTCGYIQQMSNFRDKPVLACAEAALAGNPKHLTDVKDANGETLKRTIIWDDCFTFSETIVLTKNDVQTWIDKTEKELEKTDVLDEVLQAQRRTEHVEWLQKSRTVFDFIVSQMQKSQQEQRIVPIADVLPPSPFNTWEDVGITLQEYPEGLKRLDATIVEAIDKDDDGSPIIPVRGVLDFADAVRHHSVWIDRSSVILSLPTLSLKYFVEHGGIVLDATPNPFLAAIADKVVDIRIEQPNLDVVMDASEFRGRKGLGDPTKAEESAKDLADYIKNLKDRPDIDKIACITHKPLADILKKNKTEFFGNDAVMIGHWKNDNRGHNNYMKATTIVLDGVPIIPPSAFYIDYESMRLLLERIDPDKKMEKMDVPDETGKPFKKITQLPILTSTAGVKAILPNNKDAEHYLRSLVTAEVVQAVGRLRAVRRKDQKLTVVLRTSFPLSCEYGFEVHSIVFEKNSKILAEKIKEGLDKSNVNVAGCHKL